MKRTILFLSIVALFAPPAQAQDVPEFAARLYAAHETIQPGGETELAVELTLADGWHIYHPIILDAGLPTTIEFDLPEGTGVGPLRFPIPTLASYKTGEQVREYLALEERVVVLTTLRLAADAAGQPLEISAEIRALAAGNTRVSVEARASLTLNISDETPAPANQELFEEARDEMLPLLGNAEFIEGSRLLVSHTQVPAGGKATLAAVIRVKSGHHIQDRDPGAEGLIPSRLLIESHPGVKFDQNRQIWPKPHVREMEFFGKVREQSGEFVIQAPFEISDKQFKPGPVRVRVLFQYQSCTDAGQCFMPMTAEGFVDFEIVPADVPAVENEDPIFEKLPAATEGDEEAVAVTAPSDGKQLPNLIVVLLFAFIGGAILNVMPCVLPVISLKIFGFVQQAGDDRGRIFRMGLAYAGGVMASFVVLAVLMVFAGLAWGGLMQQPGFLIGLTAVVFAFALSLLGVYEIQLPGMATSVAGEAASKEGYAGAYMNGILATLLATPCVGPFLGSAVGILAQLPALTAGAGILVVGLGMATPYVLLTAFPGWLRFLPKPGPWMVTFKQIVGFILVVVVVWLLSILIEMVDHGTILGTLGLLCLVGIGCWLLGKITLSDRPSRSATIWITALALMFGGGWTSFRVFEASSTIPWQPWEPGIAERLVEEGYTVYVDYTAKWCLTCQWNKKFVLERSRVARQFEELGIYPVKADFTNYDKQMHKELSAHNRDGVPLNLVLPAGKPDVVIVLPEVLTTGIVLDALRKAGPSRQIPDFSQEQP